MHGRLSRMAAQLAQSGGDIHMQIRHLVHPFRDGLDVFRIVGDVAALKLDSRKFADDIVSLLEQHVARRVFAAVGERPVRTQFQLLPALIPRVPGLEKRLRVGGVKSDHDTKLAGPLPDGKQAGIIDAEQAPLPSRAIRPKSL